MMPHSQTPGFSRPALNRYELIMRLDVLTNSDSELNKSLTEEKSRLARLMQRLSEAKLESKGSENDNADILCREKEIKRAQDKITALTTALENAKYNSYEIKQIKEKLERDAEALGINHHETALLAALEEGSKPVPYNVSDENIDAAIRGFETAKTMDYFSQASKIIFDDAISALNVLRPYRTFEHYDLILTGTVILVMMYEDRCHGPHHPKSGNQFFYPIGIQHCEDLTLLGVGKKALLEKTLPFDGNINLNLFNFLAPIFPNYLAEFYQLDVNPAKLASTKRTKKYFKRKGEKKLLKFFKDAYLKDYQYSFFKNPFSKMKLHLEDKTLTMKQVRAYATKNPTSRSARVLNMLIERGTQRAQIKVFTTEYCKLYDKQTFKNPFSFMRRNLTRLHSSEEIYAYAKENVRSRSAQVCDALIRDECHLRSFLKK
jgi:hypothetical protein